MTKDNLHTKVDLENRSPAFAKPVLPAVLKLTVTKQWFDLIKSGEKTEEYREIKPYWWTRLVQCGEIYKMDSYDEKASELLPISEWKMLMAKKYTHVEFKNGYSKDAPTIINECKGISVGNPTQHGSQLFDKDVFIISLGAVVWSNCG